MGNMILTVLAEILSVRIDHRRRVVINTGHLFFVDGNNDYHPVSLSLLPASVLRFHHRGFSRQLRTNASAVPHRSKVS